MKSHLLVVACLVVSAPALAAPPASKEARPPPCQDQTIERSIWPQGTSLWGTGRQVAEREMSSVLASVEMGRARLGDKTLSGLRLKGGRLVAPSASQELVGAVLQGAASDGTPVEVAVCGAEVLAKDSSLVWYRIQVWNGVSASWEDPCVATGRVPSPRALAVPGVWDESGARSDKGGKFTFACENGAIAKCVNWGYRPWAKKGGGSLAELHQACTRMARADYCGDGRSHTREDNLIDVYDGLSVLTRTTESSEAWDVKRASFEAAWSAEGATCLSRTRDGQEVETLMAQCPGRFEMAQKDLGEGDQCTVVRKGGAKAVLLRNRSYGRDEQVMHQGVAR
ncbi:hypothetical protein CYFUS_006350 [Cystobacter fuscus]|uniref:ADYC domain-containing protein n=1 Tax=Cystobacter fuscus TaxID=43 RepID=A0A250JBD7_9BACT|nr:ADYC domain-containing protein [Cystobacter fuscus]ATB40888.1 hypothetical protein CYFUS_006350 [Cystobacter fuscus]